MLLARRRFFAAVVSPPSPLSSIAHRALSSGGSGNTKTNRHEFEEIHHLSRSLSTKYSSATRRGTDGPTTTRTPPSLLVNNKHHQWKIPQSQPAQWQTAVDPDNLHSPLNYEMDALAQIHSLSFQCNILLEVRDVRLPASSHHPSMTRLAKHRTHLICYTHADLIDIPTRDKVEEWTRRSWPEARAIFIDSRVGGLRKFKTKEPGDDDDDRGKQGSQRVGPFDLMYDSLLDHLDTGGGINSALTVGVANTGKSSVLMALLQTAKQRGDIPNKIKRAAVTTKRSNKTKKKSKRRLQTGGSVGIEDVPGKTRELTEYLLRDKPKAFFLDVPGLTPPKFFFQERPEAWYGFGATNLLPMSKRQQQNVSLQMQICEYVLYCMNRNGDFGYVVKLGLDGPTTDLNAVLMATKTGKQHAADVDEDVDDGFRRKQCRTFLLLFNTGNFGPVILDDLTQKYKPFQFRDEHYRKPKEGKRRGGGYDDGGYADDDDDYDDFEG